MIDMISFPKRIFSGLLTFVIKIKIRRCVQSLNVIRQWNVHSKCEKRDDQVHDESRVVNYLFARVLIMNLKVSLHNESRKSITKGCKSLR